MILKGNARGGAKDLAVHLMKDENDHVNLHELRGFASDNLMSALNEAYAVSKGTYCRKYLYSLSLNPPETERVDTKTFEAAIQKVEDKLGLNDQPRAIVFHEKEGRRHAHCVWSRINVVDMKAVQLSFDHTKLIEISRELYLEYGWKMPRGLVNASERDPRNYTLEQWQQAKRTQQHPREIKAAFQDAWAISDSKAALTHALEERGYKIARGDRGRFVAIDMHGEVYSIARQANVKTKEVRARLGDEANLPSIEQAISVFADEMSTTMALHQSQLKKRAHIQSSELKEEQQRLVETQRQERVDFKHALHQRQKNESLQRQSRFRKGLGGIWDRLRGEHKNIQAINLKEALAADERDQKERDQLYHMHLGQRRFFKQRVKVLKTKYVEAKREINTDQKHFQSLKEIRNEYIMKSNPRCTSQRRSNMPKAGPLPER